MHWEFNNNLVIGTVFIYTMIPLLLFFSAEMLESNNLVTFEGLANSSGYHTFLLDEEKGRLVVGAKDHIFSFNLLNISKDYAQVKFAFGGFDHSRLLQKSAS